MHLARGIDALPASAVPRFVVVGVFDGLHRGHRHLLERLTDGAARRGAEPVVVTFDHHPDEILAGAAPPLLCDEDDRLALLAGAGVATTVVVHFDERLRRTTYDAFVGDLAARGPIAGFLMTPDAAFGFGRAGTPAAVAALGRTRGFVVEVVEPLVVDGVPVRSTEIRAAIAGGALDLAADLLGRRHTVVGRARRDPAADGSPVLELPLPVALPPDGAYPVRIVRGHGAPGPGGAGEGPAAGLAARAVVAAPSLILPGSPLALSPGERCRVTFEGAGEPLGAPAPLAT